MNVSRKSKNRKPKSPKPAGSSARPASRSGFRGRYVWQRRWFQTMLAVLVLFLVLSYVVPGVLGLLYAVRSVLVPVLIGLALAYIVNPVLRFAEVKLRVGRLAGTISLMLLALVLITFVATRALPVIQEQSSQLFNTVRDAYPRYLDQIRQEREANAEEQTAEADADVATPAIAVESTEPSVTVATDDSSSIAAVEDPPAAGVEAAAATSQAPVEIETESADSEPVVADGADTRSIIDKFMDNFTDPGRNSRLIEASAERLRSLDGAMIAAWAMQSLDVGVGLVGSAISFTSYLLLAAVVVGFCFFFFSWKFDAILAWFVPFIPAKSKKPTLDLLRKMDLAVSSFVRGRVIQSFVMTVILTVGWWWAGVPYWFLLGIFTGLMNLVPFLPVVGWLLALTLTVMTTLANGGDFTLALIVWPSVVYVVAQSLDGWVVEPVVQGQATNLDPLSVMLVVLIGGSLVGLLGMLLAIPLAACIKILAREWLLPKLREMAAEA